ncbi:hypothetical protein [Xenorhabdus sp. KJ12.1]|uniref:hypothetical protein n=1 Tax=Xenorhabdus sp. KJ12.1 TaxID=1851571 RepID=UPI000C04CAB3|nr:hypothetical protein [Xenorhabdus sp. KJ12.1]PHM73056.1 hypothetical protein Xekj_00267 [Xenorhabdus sp. KJ12.1]
MTSTPPQAQVVLTNSKTTGIKSPLELAERLQTYLFTWSSAEQDKERSHLIEMAIDTTNKIIESLNKEQQ